MKLFALLSGVTTLASTAFADRTSFEWSADCRDSSIITGGYPAGAIQGIARCETKWPYGVAVSGIKVWYESGSSWIRGIKLYYQNGEESETLGNEEGDTQGLEWDSYNDGIKTFKTWNDDRGTSIGHIYIETKRGYQLDVGRNVKGEEGTSQDTAGGIMLGVRGFMSWKVDGLAPLFFTSKISKVVVDEVVFDQDQQAFQHKKNMKAQLLKLQEFPNDTGAEMFFAFSGSATQTSSMSIDRPQVHIGMGTGSSYPINYYAKYPGLTPEIEADGAMRAGWRTYELSLSEATSSYSTEVKWDRDVIVPNGHTMECEAFYWYSEYISTYISQNLVQFENGKSFKYPQQGVFTGRTVSNLGTDCWDKADLIEFPRRVKRGALGK